ncbi:hypothetical protein [Actinacidiphila acididurans]|uniref:Uncharacterized protein n=1 Tax=Actinacidiphila acididurans TaxID=2784346 RepID=A0ABS2TS48_9ACTN|nr:hypothetical protein [Actinacidiphila acididurans]MBM9505642.1 hypothetical protein [Actinacidiphila acididurans]
MAELPERLRAAADAHRPDRERMLARVERGMAEPDAPSGGRRPGRGDRPPAPWAKVAAVTAAVAGAIGVGALAVTTTGGTATPERSAVTATGAPSPRPTTPTAAASGAPGRATAHAHAGTATSASGHPDTVRPHSPAAHHSPAPPADGRAPVGGGPSATPGTTAPQAPPAGSAGALTATGTVNGQSYDWAENDVTVTVTEPLTRLTVELRVALTPGVSSAGQFCSGSAQSQTTAAQATENGYLVYRWALNPGQTLQPGTYTFAGQYHHAGGRRSTARDDYAVAGTGPNGAAGVADGAF